MSKSNDMHADEYETRVADAGRRKLEKTYTCLFADKGLAKRPDDAWLPSREVLQR